LHFDLASALRKRGYDAIHIQEMDRKGYSDLDQLEYATSQQRCLFSFNVRDFVLLHNMSTEQEHFGIIVARHLPIGETLRRLLALLQKNSSESIKNTLEFLS